MERTNEFKVEIRKQKGKCKKIMHAFQLDFNYRAKNNALANFTFKNI